MDVEIVGIVVETVGRAVETVGGVVGIAVETVGDCVDVMIWLSENSSVSGLFNCGTGRARSFKELAEAVFDSLEKKPNIIYIPTPDNIRDKYDTLDDFSRTMQKYLNENEVFSKDAEDPTSSAAKQLFEKIKEMRFHSEEVNDPFARQLGEEVIETLLDKPSIYAMFIHYALRAHANSITDNSWKKKGHEPDIITSGAVGLDLAIKDIPVYIIEHYGDGKDTKRVKSKFFENSGYTTLKIKDAIVDRVRAFRVKYYVDLTRAFLAIFPPSIT
mgnify:CR=1 FL=1